MGKLVWQEACLGTVRNMLRYPIYAGAYAYGWLPTDPSREVLGASRTGPWDVDPSLPNDDAQLPRRLVRH
jgi:hypothetical protein